MSISIQPTILCELTLHVTLYTASASVCVATLLRSLTHRNSTKIARLLRTAPTSPMTAHAKRPGARDVRNWSTLRASKYLFKASSTSTTLLDVLTVLCTSTAFLDVLTLLTTLVSFREGVHDLSPEADLYPSAHEEHDVAPTLLVYVPATQSVHGAAINAEYPSPLTEAFPVGQ